MNLNATLARPLAAAVLLASFLVLATLALAASLADLSATRAERDAKADFLARSLKPGRPGLAQKAGDNADSSLSVAAESETLAAARVDALVRSTVLDAGGSVLSSRAEVKHEETSNRIEVEAVIEGRIEALQTVLFRLEGGTPLILVDELSIQPAETTGAAGTDPSAPLLHAALTLSAYWANPSARKPPGEASSPVVQ